MNQSEFTPISVVWHQFLQLVGADHPFAPLPSALIPRPKGNWLKRSQIAYLREQNRLLGEIRETAGLSVAVPNEEAAITLMLLAGGQDKKGGVPV